MIEKIINWSVDNRVLILILGCVLALVGFNRVQQTPIDAIPDLSEVQVIVKTSYPGQAPQIIEDQVTYPLSTAFLSVPKAVTVRGYSFFGDSYVYIIFEDGTDLYWARSRVLEYLSQISDRLPEGAKTSIGPDATGVGWIYQYALIDPTGQHDLYELRSLQDWFLKYELQTVPGVSEVATIGGMVKQYQIVLDPLKLRHHNVSLKQVETAIGKANAEVSGSVLELAEAEYMIRASGYLSKIEDIQKIPVLLRPDGTSLTLDQLATIRLGPEMRRGVGELDGQGEAVGGVIIMRFGENARTTIQAVEQKISALKSSLPEGVEIVTTYNRADLIDRAVDNLYEKLIEEFVVVILVCGLFLLHIRSSLVILVFLPLSILTAFILMSLQGINANIMSLGGIAIAIGAMVDASIVMVENLHRKVNGQALTSENRWRLVKQATKEVGPALFFSLMIITISFFPVFALEAQEGKLFAPLAFTKSYSMAAAAFLSITLVPVLMGYFIRGRLPKEEKNFLNRWSVAAYQYLLKGALKFPKLMLLFGGIIVVSTAYPIQKIGSEFMPELNEGDLLYMPSLFPSVSIDKAREILQITDRLIKQLPEVETVYGKVGRAETATDPAPLTMIETTIKLKPKSQWRDGKTIQALKAELDQMVQIPGVSNVWIMPIKNRIDMLSTGVKTPIGIKVSGPDLQVISDISAQIEKKLKNFEGTLSAYAERPVSGRYVSIDIDRARAARYGLNIADIHPYISLAVGGRSITETIEGLERYPVNLRFPQYERDNIEALKQLPIITDEGAVIPLAQVADIEITQGPGMIRSENARLTGWIYIDIEGSDLGAYVEQAKSYLAEELNLPAGYALSWSGQFEYLERAKDKFKIIVPATILLILVMLYLSFHRLSDVASTFLSLPIALSGGVWMVYLLGLNFSVAVIVGFLALAGVALETAIIMQLYLNMSAAKRQKEIGALSSADLDQAIEEGAALRLRPKLMTVATIFAGLLPIMIGTGTGSEIMQPIAAPMIGGMVTATFLTLFVLPALYKVCYRR